MKLRGKILGVLTGLVSSINVVFAQDIGPIESVLDNVLTLLRNIGAPIAAVVMAVAGIIMMTSGGQAEKRQIAKNTMIWAGVGFLILLLAKTIVDVLKSLVP